MALHGVTCVLHHKQTEIKQPNKRIPMSFFIFSILCILIFKNIHQNINIQLPHSNYTQCNPFRLVTVTISKS